MKMRKSIILFAAIFMIAGFTGRVIAQVTLPGNTAGATLVEVLTIANTVPLNFGVIGITAGTAGTVILNTAGLRTPDAGTTTIIATGTPSTVAEFDLTGTADAIYTIGLPLAITVTTGAGVGDINMDIDNLQVNVDGAGEATAVGAIGTLTAGASTFLLGGTLNISTTQKIGVYAGTYSVTVDYQ
jgi:hypothetical protein